MAGKQFYVSQNGEQKGPYPVDTIVKMVKAEELKVVDYIFDEKQQDWVMLLESDEVKDLLKNFKPAAPPKPKSSQSDHQPPQQEQSNPPADSVSKNSEWYILKGENKFGPFSFSDVVKMLQQKSVFEFDFAWQPGMDTWKRIAELSDFAPGKIQELKSANMPEISEVFFRRRHKRVNYGGTILVHDNKTVWKGQGVEISAGGAGVVMENAMIVPGQTLYLHFKPGDGVPPFNAICEVVSKKYVEGIKDKEAPIRYGLKFTSISENTQKLLHELSKRKAA